jgi:hypothetical protein
MLHSDTQALFAAQAFDCQVLVLVTAGPGGAAMAGTARVGFYG